ncbi:MAG: hypothetical protein HC827_16610 [Cyanobacteria bacterium RM1_2_2]|nr:hypothetical protein [Cyanobacteria bacterium RM1_2_2]
MQTLLGQKSIQPNLSLASLSLTAPSSWAGTLDVSSSLTHPSTRQFQNNAGQSPEAFAEHSTAHHTNFHDVAMGALTVLIPLGLLLSIIGYRWLRATALQRRIATLEKLWQLNCHKEMQ